ncbi:MAG: septum site-determining protein MinD [Clostridiales bacterium]|nr:septum site-determining protein MinD [Clostridiales bacterium]
MRGEGSGEGSDLKGKVAVVTSGKGGVGKSTTTGHLGAALARGGQKVALIDADIGLRNLDVVLGLEGRIVYDLIDVIEGLCGVEQAIIPSDDIPGLWLLPASQSRRQDSVQPGQMREVVAKLAERFDWVLIDCPAGVEQGFYNAVLCADVAIVVSTPDVSSVRDARKVLGLLSQEGKRDLRLIINRYDARMSKKGSAMTIGEMSALLPARIAGVIPDDAGAVAAANRGRPLRPEDGAAGAAFYRTARRLMGEDLDIPLSVRRKPAWWRLIWRNPAS